MKAVRLAGVAFVIGVIAIGCPINFGQITVKLLPDDVTHPDDQGQWAQWQLDGGDWQNSNVIMTNIPTGSHVISYKGVDSWAAPADQTINILTNGWTVASDPTQKLQSPKVAVVGMYQESLATGFVAVTIAPNDAVTAGGLWRIDGSAWYNSGSIADKIEPGTHTISFLAITGWATPADQSVVVAAGATTVATGTYVQNAITRALTVSIDPPEAVAAGAQWSLDGASWLYPSITLTNLTLGNHVVSFNNVPGFTTPANVTVAIKDNFTAVVLGTYIAETFGNVSVVLKPDEVIYYGAQWKLDNGPLQNTGVTLFGVPTGPHAISFTAISGYTTPPNQVIDVEDGQTVSVTGTYVEIVTNGGVQVTILPATAASAGGEWSLDGGDWQLSGNAIVNVEPGLHTIAFNNIPGWYAPAAQTITVTGGAVAVTSGTYTPVTKRDR